MSVTEWDNEYARLARGASQLRTAGIVKQPSDIRTLQLELQNLEYSIQSLPIQPSEIQRRKRLVQHLQQTSIGTLPPPSSSLDMIGNDGFPQQKQTQMSMALRQQDDMIDELAIGMNRLKNQTIAIGDEAKLHVNLLNDMENNLDMAQDSLEAQTRHAAQLRHDQSLWRLQLIVAALFVLLVLLIFLGLTP
jgi:hypothetical protein